MFRVCLGKYINFIPATRSESLSSSINVTFFLLSARRSGNYVYYTARVKHTIFKNILQISNFDKSIINVVVCKNSNDLFHTRISFLSIYLLITVMDH